MTASFLSAEQLVQSFKQNKLSTDEKIDLALDIISNAYGTVLPNRDEFLLEWCINQLVRSAKLEDEKSTGAPYLNPKYYELFLRLIPGNMTPHFIKATISRSAFVPVITRMLSYIGADLTNKKSNSVDLSSNLVNLAFKTLVEGAPYMEAISQDWIVKLLLATLSLTELAGGAMKDTMLDLLAFSLSELTKYFKWTGMYKKVFSTTVDQLLLPLSRCRYLLNSSNEDDPKTKKVTGLLDVILDLGLFHPNYVIDYANLISNPTAPFYRKQLFKCLRTYLAENPEPMLSIMPALLRNFLQKFSKDVRLKIGFGFSWELADIVSEILGSESDRKSTKNSSKQAQILAIQTVSEILEAIHHHNLYVPSNDQISQAQLIKLGKAYALLKSLWGGGVPKTPLLCGFCALVSIDYCLVDSDICWLWEQVASSKAEDLPSASSLGLALLQQYGFARQLERCFHAMVTALDKVTDFKQTILCHESFVIGFRCIFEQLGSASQAKQLLGLIIDLVCPSSGSQNSINHIGSILILAHVIGGLPSNLLPPVEIEQAIFELGSSMFSDCPESDLLSELSSLAEELHMPAAAQSKSLFKPIAILYLFANIQDRWPKMFISEAILSQIVAWCRKNRSKLPRSTSLVTSWEHFLTRLLLQHIETAVREETLSVESACAYFKLCIRFLECSDCSVRDGIIHTLLGPYLPFVAELMHPEERKSFVQILVSDILEPTCPFNQLFSNARFFEIAGLRKIFLGELLDRFTMCFPKIPVSQHPHSLSFGATDHGRFNSLQSILSSLNQDSAYNKLEQPQLDILQRILLVLTHCPSSYLSPNYRAILLLAVRVHQELLSSSQDPPTVLQAGWEINLALICTFVDSDLALVRQKRNQKPYLFWLLDTVTNFLAKLSKQTHLLIDQLTHIIGSSLIIALSHSNDDEIDLTIFEDLTFSLSISPAMVLKYEILSQVIRKICSNPKHSEKLRLKNISLFQATTLCGHWQSLESVSRVLPSQVTGIEMRTALALMSLYASSAVVCSDFAWLETHQVTFSRLLATCHHFLDTAPQSSETAAILESGIELHRALVCSYPQGFISEDKLLPTVASFTSFCKKISSLSATASFSDLSTAALLHSASELLARIDSLQWNTVFGAIIEHLLSLPDGEQSRATFFSLTLLLGDTTEAFRKVLVSSLPQVVHNLVQLLILKPGLRKDTLTMVADIVRRPDFHLPANTLGVLLSCIRNLPISDAESENLLGRILIRIMKGHTAGISSNLPALVSALGRVSQSQTVDMGMVLQCLPTNKQVPGIQHHIQYLLILLINAQEHTPADSSAFIGWFYCFDALQSTSLESLLEWLNPTQQHMLKRAHQEYLKHHKFVGKV